MRKQVVIGLFVLAVVGVGGYLLYGPKNGTVEWHAHKYLQYTKGPWAKRLPNFIADILGLKRTHILYEHPDQEVHRKALINMRYLGEAEVVLVHKEPRDVIREAKREIRDDPRIQSWEFVHVDIPSTNVLRVVAKAADLPVFISAIRKADISEN